MIAAAIPAAIVAVAAVKHWVTPAWLHAKIPVETPVVVAAVKRLVTLAWLHVKIPVETPVQTLVAAHVS